jgi:hypothetical protein
VWAVVLLIWQRSDRRNRRFTFGLFGATLLLICAMYPLFALVKNELMVGPGHVSLEWAVRWQLFDRTGSGDIFDPHSTAHAVIRSWVLQDPWLPRLALLTVLPGLVIRRTRAVAFAFGLQLIQLLRNGYLPYPYVIAMIPFAALTIAGVLDAALGLGRGASAAARSDRPARGAGRNPLRALVDGVGVPPDGVPDGTGARVLLGLRLGGRLAALATCAWLVVGVAQVWSVPLHELRTVDPTVVMTQQLDRHRVDARVPGVRARRERRQLTVIGPWEMLPDVANLGRHEVKVVEQPFPRGGDRLPLAHIVGQRAIGEAQHAGVVVEAREDGAAPAARVGIDREARGQRQRPFFQPLDAEQLVAKRLFRRRRRGTPQLPEESAHHTMMSAMTTPRCSIVHSQTGWPLQCWMPAPTGPTVFLIERRSHELHPYLYSCERP